MFCNVPVPCDILDLVDHLRDFFALAGNKINASLPITELSIINGQLI